MKKNIKQTIRYFSALAAIALITQGCAKENVSPANNVNPGNYAYNPASLQSIVDAVNRKYGTTIDTSDLREDYVRGIVDPYNPGITCYKANWFCEIVIWGKVAGKSNNHIEGSTADIIACTPSTPTLYKNVTITKHVVTENGSQTLFEKQ